jgi:hypothetical protein
MYHVESQTTRCELSKVTMQAAAQRIMSRALLHCLFSLSAAYTFEHYRSSTSQKLQHCMAQFLSCFSYQSNARLVHKEFVRCTQRPRWRFILIERTICFFSEIPQSLATLTDMQTTSRSNARIQQLTPVIDFSSASNVFQQLTEDFNL